MDTILVPLPGLLQHLTASEAGYEAATFPLHLISWIGANRTYIHATDVAHAMPCVLSVQCHNLTLAGIPTAPAPSKGQLKVYLARWKVLDGSECREWRPHGLTWRTH